MNTYAKVFLNPKQSLFIVLLYGAAISLFFSQLAYAQISEFKITAADGGAGDRFGSFVSISGDYATGTRARSPQPGRQGSPTRSGRRSTGPCGPWPSCLRSSARAPS